MLTLLVKQGSGQVSSIGLDVLGVSFSRQKYGGR